jgi:hypothetical protein
MCRLHSLQVLANAIILRSESRGTHTHILLYPIGDSPILEDQVPVSISPRNRVTPLYHQAVGSLLLPPTSRRAAVEVFDPASTREISTAQIDLELELELLYDWRFTAKHFVLAPRPLRFTARFFSTEDLQ